MRREPRVRRGRDEIAFSFRDVAAEADALERWYGGRPEAVLELAGGPVDHAIEFARRGVRAAALDLSSAMYERARGNAAARVAPAASIRCAAVAVAAGRRGSPSTPSTVGGPASV